MDELNFVNRLTQVQNQLSKTELILGDYLISNMKEISQMTIQQLAKQAEVSNATVTRFCKKLNYASFAELKSYLARETKKAPAKKNQSVEIVGSFYDSMVTASKTLIDEQQLAALVKAIKEARKITVCGIGSSGLTANEFKYQLMRMGLTVDCVTDPHMMLMAAKLLEPTDLLICISNSGETQALVKACHLARENNVTIGALTNFKDSTLTNLADIFIYTSSVKSMHEGRFINTQLTMYFVLDCLFYELLGNQDLYQKRSETLQLILDEEGELKN